VNKIVRKKRICYAKIDEKNLLDYWDIVLWPDESKFNLFQSDGKTRM
jgi:hypothetical protein